MKINDKYTMEAKDIAARFTSAMEKSGIVSAEMQKSACERLNREFYNLLNAHKPKIMVYGIYNSGKSTLVNAICGQALAQVADRPMTDRIAEYDAGQYILIDSPGIDAPMRHEEIADRQLKECHIILFVISSKGGFESLTNYKKMNELIHRGTPFYIVLNDRGAALPDDKAQWEAARLQHETELNQIKRKIIENLIKVSGENNISDKYEVIVLNAKRAWKGVEKNNSAIVESSNLPALRSRILTILEEKGAMVWLETPLAALDVCMSEVESDLYKQSGSADYAGERHILQLKMENARELLNGRIQSVVESRRSEVYNLKLHANHDNADTLEEGIIQDVEHACQAELVPLIHYIRAKFPELPLAIDDDFTIHATASGDIARQGAPSLRQEVGNLPIAENDTEDDTSGLPDLVLNIGKTVGTGVAADAAVSLVTGTAIPIAGPVVALWSTLRTWAKGREKREQGKYEQLLLQINAANQQAEVQALEQMRIRQDARASANVYLDKLSRDLRQSACALLDQKFTLITRTIDQMISERQQIDKQIRELLLTLRELRQELSALRLRNG